MKAEGQETLVYLDPAQIIEPETTNVRPWSSKVGDTEVEIEKITRLAATIEEEGQIQPVRVRRVGEDGVFELIAGRRRKKAIELINAGRKAGEELKIKAVVADGAVSDPSAFRQAAIENWHREGLSPMDMSADIATVRENFKWHGGKGTKKVAEFFKVSPATITQHETLGKLGEAQQAKVHTGEISRDDAFKLSAIADKGGAAAADAALAEGEQAEADVAAAGGGKKKAKAAKSTVIKKKKREVVPDAHEPRSRKEILEFFEGMQGPVYGHANGAVYLFVDALVKYAAGELTDRTLTRYWDACVEKAPKGTPAPVEKSAAAETKEDKDKQADEKPAKKKAAKKKK